MQSVETVSPSRDERTQTDHSEVGETAMRPGGPGPPGTVTGWEEKIL